MVWFSFDQDTQSRAGWVAGLRAVADFYEHHPVFPLPLDRAITVAVGDADKLGALVRLLGGRRFKDWTDQALYVGRVFAGVRLELSISRHRFCTSEIAGPTVLTVCPPVLSCGPTQRRGATQQVAGGDDTTMPGPSDGPGPVTGDGEGG